MAEVIKWLGLQQPQHEKQKCPPRSCHSARVPFLPPRLCMCVLCACVCMCLRRLFYDIFIDELWFLFGAFPYTRRHARQAHTYVCDAILYAAVALHAAIAMAMAMALAFSLI